MLIQTIFNEVGQYCRIIIIAFLGHFRILRYIVVVVINTGIINAVGIQRHIALHLSTARAMQSGCLSPTGIMAIVTCPYIAIHLPQAGIFIAIADRVEFCTALLMLAHTILYKIF